MSQTQIDFAIDRLCDEFEARPDPVSSPRLSVWLARLEHEFPAIAASAGSPADLALVKEARRSLISNLVAIDLWQRRRRRLTVSSVLYEDLFPEFEFLVYRLIEGPESSDGYELEAKLDRAKWMEEVFEAGNGVLPIFLNAEDTRPTEATQPPDRNPEVLLPHSGSIAAKDRADEKPAEPPVAGAAVNQSGKTGGDPPRSWLDRVLSILNRQRP